MGKLNVGMIKNIILVIILIIMVFTTFAETSSDVTNSTDELQLNTGTSVGFENQSGLPADTFPLMSFFKKKGVVLLALVAGVVIVVVSAVLPKGK